MTIKTCTGWGAKWLYQLVPLQEEEREPLEESIWSVTEGLWIAQDERQRKGEIGHDRFLESFSQDQCCIASTVRGFLVDLKEWLPNTGPGEGFISVEDTDDGLEDATSWASWERTCWKHTGHCFGTSSAAEAANNGANDIDLERRYSVVRERAAPLIQSCSKVLLTPKTASLPDVCTYVLPYVPHVSPPLLLWKKKL